MVYGSDLYWTQQGWLYLCVFLDAYSRKVVGFSVEDSMAAAMVNEGLKMALRRRQINDGMIVHSDQGIQYASGEFRDLLALFKIKQSMSRKGDCWDNSMAESFFATIKKGSAKGKRKQLLRSGSNAFTIVSDVIWWRQPGGIRKLDK